MTARHCLKLAGFAGALTVAASTAGCGDDAKTFHDVLPPADAGFVAADAPSLCPASGTGLIQLTVIIPCDVPGAVKLPGVEPNIADGGSVDGGSSDGGAVPAGASRCTIGAAATEAFPHHVELSGGSLSAPVELGMKELLSLPAGPDYILKANRVAIHPAAGSKKLVGKSYAPTQAPFDGCVRSGETRNVTVVYAQEPGSEKLWVAGEDASNLVAYAPASLAAPGRGGPSPIFGRWNGRIAPHDLALDGFGNLWVADRYGIAMYPLRDLARDFFAPAVELYVPLSEHVSALAFDDQGKLWVAILEETSSKIVKIAPSRLSISVPLEPLVTITLPSLAPADLAFDSQGNLWVVSSTAGTVMKFNKSRLAADQAGDADVTLTAAAGDSGVRHRYNSPRSLAFDRGGNLWVGFGGGGHPSVGPGAIVRFTPADLAASKHVDNPLYKRTEFRPLIDDLAFDEQGGLWFATARDRLVRLAPEDLASSGFGDPDREVIMNLGPLKYTTVKLLFNPPPAGLPISH